MRVMAAGLLGVVLAVTLTACGGRSDSAPAASGKGYCSAVKALVRPRPAPRALVAGVQAAGNAAPGEVAGKWHDIGQAVVAYAEAARRSRLDPAHPPYGLTPAKTRALNKRLLANAYRTNVGPVSRQIRAVRKQVRNACGVRTSL